jgi:hypothetical protein
LGSGILKILLPPQFLHDDVFCIIVFIGYSCKPIGGALLWGAVVSDASVVDYPYVTFFLMDLSSARWHLCIARGTTWSLVVPFLSAVACKVTGFPAEETCEDFPLSVLLDGPSWISAFSAPSHSLFVPISSWEEIFGFCYTSARSSWGCVHCIWVLLRISPLVAERPPGCDGW